MQTSSHSRLFRLTLFALLYFVQGSSLAYFTTFQKPYLNSFNIDADAIALLSSLLLLPFILKIFFGILSDRVSLFGAGHRKPYIILGLILAIITFAAAAFISPGSALTLFAVVVFLGSFSVALFDSITDGLAVDTTPQQERGLVQGLMSGGRAVGLIVLSLTYGLLASRPSGYTLIFLIMAALMLIPLVMTFFVRESAAREGHQRFEWGAFKALVKPMFLVFAVYAILSAFASYGANGLITFHLDETFNATPEMIGTYGMLRGIGAVIGALLAGIAADKLGRQMSTIIGIVTIAIGALLHALAPDANTIMLLGLGWGVVWGFQNTVTVILAMDLSDTRIAASMFAIIAALLNIGIALGEGIATGLTDNIGFASVFFLLAGVGLVVLPLAFLLFRLMSGTTPSQSSSVAVSSGD